MKGKMLKQSYENAEIEITLYELSDIITSSVFDDDNVAERKEKLK